MGRTSLSEPSRLTSLDPFGTKYVGPIAGRYSLSSRASARGPKVFACRSQSLTASGVVLSAPVQGELGERVNIKLDHFSILPGQISRLISGGFALDFMVNEDARAEINAKIGWIKKFRTNTVQEKRSQKRIIPPHPKSAVILKDGTEKECFMIDVSKSGVAVSVDLEPKLGERIWIGRTSGHVVRFLEAGFAVEFDDLIDLDKLDELFGVQEDEGEPDQSPDGA